jgi:hypothetical protein
MHNTEWRAAHDNNDNARLASAAKPIATTHPISRLERHFGNNRCTRNSSTCVETFSFVAVDTANMTRGIPPLANMSPVSRLCIDLDQIAPEKLHWIKPPGQA